MKMLVGVVRVVVVTTLMRSGMRSLVEAGSLAGGIEDVRGKLANFEGTSEDDGYLAKGVSHGDVARCRKVQTSSL